jgi:hemerythrin
MVFIAWRPEFSVGIVELDDDHRHLIALLNESHSALAMDEDKGRLALRSILESLIWYTRSHFKAEEVLMQHYAYPKSASHKAEHDRLTKQVTQFANSFKLGSNAISLEVATMLEEEWLGKHILQCDAAYAHFFRSNGMMDMVIKHVNGQKAARERHHTPVQDWLRHGRVAAPHW